MIAQNPYREPVESVNWNPSTAGSKSKEKALTFCLWDQVLKLMIGSCARQVSDGSAPFRVFYHH